MAFPKTELYPEEEQRVAFYAKSIAHPERVRILKDLRSAGPIPVFEIHKDSPLALTTLSQHLAILRRAEMVDYVIRDPHIYYSLNDDVCRRALALIQQFLQEVGVIPLGQTG